MDRQAVPELTAGIEGPKDVEISRIRAEGEQYKSAVETLARERDALLDEKRKLTAASDLYRRQLDSEREKRQQMQYERDAYWEVVEKLIDAIRRG